MVTGLGWPQLGAGLPGYAEAGRGPLARLVRTLRVESIMV